MKELVVAVAGQPNSGKSTIFNMLTGSRQFIANYPGVTVEKKVGKMRLGEHRLTLVDLPGTYSLTSYSLEERVARNYLLQERPDLILNVVDASNLERHLILSFQLLQLKMPLVMALNMIDVAGGRGIDIDSETLGRTLGIRVIPTVAKKRRGKKELCRALLDTYYDPTRISPFQLNFGEKLENVLSRIEEEVATDGRSKGYNPRWLALKLLANDEEVRKIFAS